jgi:cell wall-associated NlpC family hydrolase
MTWWGKYVGRPYNHQTANCWTLIREIYLDRLGIAMSDFTDVDPQSSAAVARRMAREQRYWQSVEAPAPYDVVLMRHRDHGVPVHVGIATGGRGMLHTTPATGAVHVLMTDISVRSRIVGFRRHPDVSSRALV